MPSHGHGVAQIVLWVSASGISAVGVIGVGLVRQQVDPVEGHDFGRTQKKRAAAWSALGRTQLTKSRVGPSSGLCAVQGDNPRQHNLPRRGFLDEVRAPRSLSGFHAYREVTMSETMTAAYRLRPIA